jgi:hypothetical protein
MDLQRDAHSVPYADFVVEVVAHNSSVRTKSEFGHCILRNGGVSEHSAQVEISVINQDNATSSTIRVRILAPEEHKHTDGSEKSETWCVPLGHSDVCPASLIDKTRLAPNKHIRVAVCVLIEHNNKALVRFVRFPHTLYTQTHHWFS